VKEVVLTPHAELMLRERGIDRAWVLQTIHAPERSDADPAKAGRVRAFRRVPEYEGRWLRVVYEEAVDRTIVVTAFFDRGAGRWA
jgi:hypothetical protein